MAKKQKASLSTVSKANKYNTKWLRNAMKSVGISASEVIKDISPNIYEVTSSSINTSRDIVTAIRKNKTGTNRIADTLKTNKYIKYAQTAYKNAMSDIKTGNFNNTERQEQSMSSNDDINDLTSGFSFGDDGADSQPSNVNVNYINSSDNEGMTNLSNQMREQSTNQLKVQKASMDAYIAVSAAGMQQVGEIGTQIVNQLTNVNSNLTALVQYNNENMSRFIEASIAYYEHSGSKGKDSTDSKSPDKITAKDVMNGSSGGINLSRYKSYVKQQFKGMVDNSNAGLLKSLVDDDTMMNMLVSNPLGFLSKGLMSYMVPKILRTSLESMETTFSNFMPVMLSQLADLADDTSSGIIGNIKRGIGTTFGLRNKRINKFGNAKIERGSISFDGETKHAITEIITKELRDQTGYLQIIANHYDRNAKETARKNGEYWSWESNSYIKRDKIDSEISEQIVSAVRNAFTESKFGSSMRRLVDGYTDENSKKEMEFSLDELFMEIEKSGKHLSLPDLISLVEKGGANQKTKKIIIKYIKKMAAKDVDAYQNLNVARLQSQHEANEIKNRIREDSVAYQLHNSSFAGDVNIDDVVARTMGFGRENANNRRAVRSVRFNDMTRPSGNAGGNLLASVTGHAKNIMQSIMAGDTRGLFQQGTDMIVEHLGKIGNKVSTVLFGEKNDDGNRKGGIFSGVGNSFNDMIASMKYEITGKGYTDSKGTTFEDKDDSVAGNFRKMGNIVKDGVMLKLFGKEKDESGKYVKSQEGIFGNIVNVFKEGFDGWTDAFFGNEDAENAEELRKKQKENIIKYAKEALPNTITGSVLGAGVGMVTGGSLLGMLVGGPLGGAAMGAATGFLSKNEKFQNWLFGEKDEDGNRIGGLISKNAQEYLKKNKTFLAGSAAIGIGSGALGISGGGLLGTLVGGPVAGAIMGLAGGVVLKSKTFNQFLFGDEEKGQKGIFKAVADAFNNGFGSVGLDSGVAKAMGMGAIGAIGGGLTAAILGKIGILGASLTPLGPIGGALAGLALSIKAQSGSFKEWLFGKDDGLDIGGGKKAKKQGVVGQIGNMINANIIRPMKTELSFIGKDFMNTVKHDILAPFAFAAEGIAGQLGNMGASIVEGVTGALSPVANAIKDGFSNAIGPVTKGIGKAMESVTDFAYKTAKNIISTPGLLIKATFDVLQVKERIEKFTKPITDLFKDVRHLIFKGIGGVFNLAFKGVKGLFKGIFNVATAPFKLIGKGVKGVGNFLGEHTSIGRSIRDRYTELKEGSVGDSLRERFSRDRYNAKVEAKQIRKERDTARRHDKNAQLIAKWSKGQFSEDTEEAREWLKYHKPEAYRKLVDIDPETGKSRNTSITEEQNAARIAREGRGTAGMSSDEISRANLAELNDEGRQTYFLQGIFNILKGKNWDGSDKEGRGTGGSRGNGRQDNQNTESVEGGSVSVEENATEESESDDNLSERQRQHQLDNRVFGRTRQNIYKMLDSLNLTRFLPHKAEGGLTEEGYAVVGEEGAEIVKTSDGDEVINEEQADAKIEDKRKKKSKRELRRRKRRAAQMRRKALALQQADMEESSDATIEDIRGASTRSQAKALDNAKTAKERQKEVEEEKMREEQRKHNKAMLESTKENTKTNKKFALDWSKIFSKNGLITSAAIAGMLFLKNKLPEVFDTISSIASTILSLIGGTGNEIVKDIVWTQQNAGRTNGNTMAEQAEKIIDDILAGNILTDENGEATRHSASRLRLLGRLGMNYRNSGHEFFFDSKTTRAQKKFFEGTKKVGNAVKGSKIVQGAKDKGSKLASKVKNAPKNIKGLKNKASIKVKATKDNLIRKGRLSSNKNIRNIADKAASIDNKMYDKRVAKSIAKRNKTNTKTAKLLKRKEGNTKLKQKIIKAIDEFFDLITSKFVKSGGKKGATDSVRKTVTRVLKDKGDDIAKKVAGKVGGKSTAKAVGSFFSYGISEAIYASIGAIEGISGTAKLFQVSPDKVDGTMRTISGIFGALAGTTIGGIVDAVFSIIGDIVGFDLLHSMAVSMYNVLVGADSEKAANLEISQKEFKDAYLEERDKTLEKQWKTQKKAGIIGKDVTYEQFVDGVKDGTYSASYTSFQDWNVKKNKSLGDKMISGIGIIGKGAIKGAKKIGGALFGSKSTTYTDSNGNTYTQGKDGMWVVTDASGKKLGSISEDAIPSDAKKTTTKTKGLVGVAISLGKKGIKSLKKDGVKKTAKKTAAYIADTAKKVKDKATDLAKKGVSKAKGLAKKAGKTLDWLVTKETTTGYLASDGTYYDAEGQHYSANGDKMDKISLVELSKMIASGELTESEITTKERGITILANKAKKKLNDTWKSASKTISDFADKFKNKISEFGRDIGNGAKKAATATKNFFVNHKEKAWFATDGSYYMFNGKSFTHYSANGDVIGEGIEGKDIRAMTISGELREGEKVVDSTINKGLKTVGKGLMKAWTTSIESLTKFGSSVAKGASKLWTDLKASAKALPGKAHDFFLNHKEKRWHSTEGGYYQTNGSTFDYYNEAGDKIAEGITVQEFDKLCKSGVVVAEEGKEVTVNAGIVTKFAELRKSIGDSFNKSIKSAKKMFTVVGKTASSLYNEIKEKGVKGFLDSKFKDEKTLVWYDTQGNYYKLEKGGKYTHYNVNGDVLEEDIDAEKVESMMSSGLLTKGEIIKDAPAKKAMKKITKAVKAAWDKAGDTVKNGWEKFSSWITGGKGNGGSGTGFDYASQGGHGSGTKIVRGGRGPETLNGGTFYSQNDPRWANNAYNMGNDNATMGNSGCGPTAMAMVASDVTGRNVNPTDMANLAKMTGNRDDTGTNWNFINQASNAIGVNSNQKLNPTASDISAQLDNGGPVILSGTGSGTGADPYTKNGHYVVATGKDENGNVIVNDPRGREYSKKYNISSIASKTGSSWSFGGRGGFGPVLKNKIVKGGRGVDVSKWLDIVRAVKKAIAAKKPGYSQSRFIKITVGGKTLSVRTDCSGYVGACLKFFGVLNDKTNVTSYTFTNANDSTIKKTGFSSRSWGGWNNLKEGDIIATKGHVEIFAYNKGNKHYVYNCGSDKSTNSPVPTVSGHSSYTTVWSPGAAGSNAVSGTVDSGTSSGSSDSGGNVFDKLSSTMSGFFSEFGSRALSGDFKSTNYDSVFSGNDSSSSSDTSGGTYAAANITGNNVEKSVWDYFTGLGYSKAATTGILANLKQESGVNPKAIQGNGRGPAAGIAQWENYNTKSGRWKNLYNYAKKKGKDWTDLGSQLEFMHHELQNLASVFWKSSKNMSKAGTSPTTYKDWKNSTNYETATRQFEGAFERAGKPNMPRRLSYAKAYYDKFAKGGKGGGFGDSMISSRTRSIMSSTVKPTGGRGEIDYYSIAALQNSNASSGYSNAVRSSSVAGNKEIGVNDLLMNVIEILSRIAGNTSEASSKLNALNELKNLGGGGNNVIVTGTSNATNNVSNKPKSLNSTSKKDITAREIARGGY